MGTVNFCRREDQKQNMADANALGKYSTLLRTSKLFLTTPFA